MSQINVKSLSNENDDGAPKIEGAVDFSATTTPYSLNFVIV